ncbi:MAG: hypothetical protein FJY91_02540 [Candidatus Harrisonbacteria bacterium]|nr:hypothetical protein [Candidatus Harrisonbacteria bacterium]
MKPRKNLSVRLATQEDAQIVLALFLECVSEGSLIQDAFIKSFGDLLKNQNYYSTVLIDDEQEVIGFALWVKIFNPLTAPRVRYHLEISVVRGPTSRIEKLIEFFESNRLRLGKSDHPPSSFSLSVLANNSSFFESIGYSVPKEKRNGEEELRALLSKSIPQVSK